MSLGAWQLIWRISAKPFLVLTTASPSGMTSYQMAIPQTNQGLNKVRPLRPAEYVERKVVTSILEGTYPPGSVLPDERTLAKQLGVTRPTLRETLQRLASEGWITIRHGKPTVVNDYWEQGGLSVLSTLARYDEHLPDGFVAHLLEVRVTLLPAAARMAARNAPEALLEHLGRAESLDDDPEKFAEYDWELQLLMVKHSRNPVFTLIYNDFAAMFKTMGVRYFRFEEARDASRTYYVDVSRAIEQGGEDVERIVGSVMERVMGLWSELKCSQEVK